MIDEARRRVASAINCTARRIVFTGGGSESNNLAIKGAAFARKDGKHHLITSRIEHPAVLNTCEWLSRNGYDVTFLGVDGYGIVDPDDVEPFDYTKNLSCKHYGCQQRNRLPAAR